MSGSRENLGGVPAVAAADVYKACMRMFLWNYAPPEVEAIGQVVVERFSWTSDSEGIP